MDEAVKIQPNDIVRGERLISLIHSYKAYDQHQKKLINKLMADVDRLSRKLALLTTAPDDKATKILNQADNIHHLEAALREWKLKYAKLEDEYTQYKMSVVSNIASQ